MKTLFKKSLLVLMVMFITVISLGVTSKVKAADYKYTFSSYAAGTQYATNEKHVLDDKITITTTKCHFTSELRIYSSSTYNGFAVIENTSSSEKITKLILNCGNKADKLAVYGSNDSSTWTTIKTVSTTSSYTDYTVEISNDYKYIKLDVVGSNQVRLKYFTVSFEKNVDESMDKFFENLNNVSAFMSLAYTYNTTETITQVPTASNITFNNVSKRTNFSTEQQVWEENNITVTNNKASSSTNIGDYSNPVRFYQNSQLVVSMDSEITSIMFDCNSESYASALKNSIPSSLGTTLQNVDKVTLNLDENALNVTITFGAQVRMDGITVYSYKGEEGISNSYSDVDFRLKCAIDSEVKELTDLPDGKEYTWGIQVKTIQKTMHYNLNDNSDLMDSIDNKEYVVISLDDVLNNIERLNVAFTVSAYVVIDGITYYSESAKTYSVVDLVKVYYGMADYKEQVTPLVEVLTSLGYSFE